MTGISAPWKILLLISVGTVTLSTATPLAQTEPPSHTLPFSAESDFALANLTSSEISELQYLHDFEPLVFIDWDVKGPDCITRHDDRCECCKWHWPKKPYACLKLKCCPCINHHCDPKDPACDDYE